MKAKIMIPPSGIRVDHSKLFSLSFCHITLTP
jgi:hypothetical protein